MIRLVARRLLAVVPTLLIVTFLVFLLVKLVPTDPAVTAAGGTSATQEDIARTRKELHLDDSLPTQYFRWLEGAVQGDLGDSYTRKTPVNDEVARRVPVTMGLIIAATVFALLIAIPLGIFSGLRPNGAVDRASRFYASLAVAVPSFVLAQLLVVAFAVELKWLPPSGYTKFGDDSFLVQRVEPLRSQVDFQATCRV